MRDREEQFQSWKPAQPLCGPKLIPILKNISQNFHCHRAGLQASTSLITIRLNGRQG